MPSAQHQPTALLVEDEWLVRMELADALAEAGWEVIESGSGEEAVALIGERAPDILITDIRLTGALSGWDVAEAYRAALPGRPVVYASANSCEPTRAVQGSVFLAKPSRIEQLLVVCARLVKTQSD